MRTGDIAVIDPDSTLHIVDRAKDVIKSGGEWISSQALEEAAMRYPGGAGGRSRRHGPPTIAGAATSCIVVMEGDARVSAEASACSCSPTCRVVAARCNRLRKDLPHRRRESCRRTGPPPRSLTGRS